MSDIPSSVYIHVGHLSKHVYTHVNVPEAMTEYLFIQCI